MNTTIRRKIASIPRAVPVYGATILTVIMLVFLTVTQSARAAEIALTLDPVLRLQLETWQKELDLWLDENPTVTTGATYDDVVGQYDFYALLLQADGTTLDTGRIRPYMTEIMRPIIESYIGARELVYAPDSKDVRTISRSTMLTLFNTIYKDITAVDIIAEAPTEKERIIVGDISVPGTCSSFPNCTQISVPFSGAVVGDWVEGAGDGGGDFDHAGELDETIALTDDSTTYWETPTNPVASSIIITTTDPFSIDPGIDTDHFVRFRLQKNSNAGKQIDVTYAFWDGSVHVIATRTETDIGTGWATYTITMTEGEAALMSGGAGDAYRVFGASVGGGGPRKIQYSTAELEMPDEPPPAAPPLGGRWRIVTVG